MLLGYAGVDRITVIFTCTNFPIVKWSIDTVFQPKEREREKKVNFRHPERIMIISMQLTLTSCYSGLETTISHVQRYTFQYAAFSLYYTYVCI